jgi:hypothetical protein
LWGGTCYQFECFLTFSGGNSLLLAETGVILIVFLPSATDTVFIFFSFSFRRDLSVLGGQQIQNNGQNSQATADTFYSDLFKNNNNNKVKIMAKY